MLVAWTRLLARHRILLTIILVLLGILFSRLSAGVRWQADILQFFSSNSADVRSVAAASQQPGIATQLRLDVHASTPHDDADVLAATKDLAEKLRNTGEFRLVWTGVQTTQLATAYQHLLATGPILLDEAGQKEVESRATPEFLQKRLAAAKEKLADPDGELLLAQTLNDPLDIGGLLSHRLQNLSPVGNGENTATFEDGILVTRDPATGLHAMIVTEPLSLPSNQKAAEKTLNATYAAIAQTQKQFAAHPIDAWVIGAHRGYVENAHRVITDVTRVSILGSVAVALAIALYFRRIATAILCILPASIGIGIALGLAGAFHIELPLILLGFAGLLCGSTTDYGIQIISELHRLSVGGPKGTWNPATPARAARRMLGPISMSVATSVTGFAALGLSDSPGLRALGLFVAAATLCIWLITFLILPAYMGPWLLQRTRSVSAGTTPAPKTGTSLPRTPSSNNHFFSLLWWGGCLTFLALTLLLARTALHVRFDSDPRSLDGSSATARTEEASFFHVWGNLLDRAVILCRAATPEEALTLSQKATSFCQDLLRDNQIAGFISPTSLLPDNQTAAQRAAARNAYWTPARLAELRTTLATAAKATGFKPAALEKFADHLATIAPPSATTRLQNSPAALFPGFLSTSPNQTTLASIVQMRTDRPPRLETGWAQELRLRQPTVLILSGKMLAFDAVERARAEGERLAPWCFFAILFPLWLYFRKLRRAWLALACLLVGFLWVLGSAQLFGHGLNLLSLVPILFTLGVAVDYGIYAATTSAEEQSSRLAATFLCALTTILGSAALLLATHPAMRWLGITLVAGVTGGYLTSLFIVAPIATRKRTLPRPRRSIALAWTASTIAALATILLAIPVIAEWLLTKERPADLQPIPHLTAIQTTPHLYQAGNNWLRWRPASPTTGLWEMSITGSPEARGAALAALASPIDVRIENEMLTQFDELVPDEWARWLLLRTVGTNLLSLPSYTPLEYQRELYAAATSYNDPHAYLAPSYPRILSYHALHDVSQMLIDNPLIVPNQFACTGIISLPAYSAKQNGHLMLGRVFDFEGGESFGRQKSLTYIIPPPGEGIPFAHVAWPGLAGCVTGMNAEKIALFLNAAATKDYRRIGTPTIFMARQILQHARTLDDAEKIIRSTSVFVSDIIVVADGKTGHARIFEKSPAATATRDVQLSAVVTNHLTTPTFADDPVNRERMADSTTMQRHARARQLLDRLHNNITPQTLATILRDKKGLDDHDIGFGNRNAIDGLIACHAVIMDVTAGKMWIAAWPNCEGAFLGIDITQMLDHAPHPADFTANADPAAIPEDPILHDGTWQHIEKSRTAQEQSLHALRAHNLPAAIAAAREALANNPNFYFGHELLGRALLQQHETAAARHELQTALSLEPPYAKRIAEIQNLLNQLPLPHSAPGNP
ncbi:MAG: C45 family autoproteolytic acyltransferase/hydrolase [Phycisphaerae bacterium]